MEAAVNVTESVTAAEIKVTARGYGDRLREVAARLAAYDTRVTSRRGATDTYHDVARSLRAVTAWLGGDYDRSYAGPHPSFGSSLQDFREHYAGDSLRGALHHLVWCEHYAGIRTAESARSLDPWG